MPRLAIVTATTNAARAEHCIRSWVDRAAGPVGTYIIHNGGERTPYLGTVPAFRKGVDLVLAETDAEIIACFHDDLEILEPGWDERVLRHFDRQPACGLAGFGGAIGLGRMDLYDVPYAPINLARVGFRSNLRDAERHGYRSLVSEPVVCLDGFSQIGRREFWQGFSRKEAKAKPVLDQLARELADEFRGKLFGFEETDALETTTLLANRPWSALEDLGIVHHFYDGLLGCLARRYGWEVWYLPVSAVHYGGRTAVGDPGYQEWAKTQTADGDHGFWEAAHRIGYDHFRDVLPLRV